MKRRVAIITHDTSAVGGLPTMVSFLHKTLTDSGRFEPHLISLATSVLDGASVQVTSPKTWFRRPEKKSLRWLDMNLTHFGAWGSDLEFQRYRPRRELTRYLKQFDLLQFVVGSPPWACVASEAGRPLLIWTATTTRADRESQIQGQSKIRRFWSSLMVPLTERYERKALKAADRIFVLSDYTRRTIEPIAGDKEIQLAPCGVDLALFHPTAEKKGDYILCVARFSDARKNVRLLLSAYAAVKSSLRNVPNLMLVGEPPSAELLTSLEELGLTDSVRLVGNKKGEELAELYRQAQFFVLSSNEEGLGIVILEAMASGLAVISTDCGGPATAVRHSETGLLTPVGDVHAFANAMKTLIVDSELRGRMGTRARIAAEERFNRATSGNIFLEAYDNLLTGEGFSPERGAAQNRLSPLAVRD